MTPGSAPTCEHCHGLGWLKLDVPVTDRRFGKFQPCTCNDGRQNIAAIAERRAARWGIEPNRRQTFETFRVTGLHASVHTALKAAQGFAGNPQRCLVLWGEYGCGKTHLSMAVVNTLLSNGVSTLAFTAPDLLDMLRSGYGDNSYDQLMRAARTVPVLIIDDLGRERGTEWADEKLYQIINVRYHDQRPLLISSNLNPAELADRRIADRLCDERWSLRINITGGSYRRRKTQ